MSRAATRRARTRSGASRCATPVSKSKRCPARRALSRACCSCGRIFSLTTSPPDFGWSPSWRRRQPRPNPLLERSNIMTTPADLQALLRAEKLDEAIEHLNAEVKKNPTAIDRRAQLAELLCVAGNLDRADTVLNAITDIDPGAMVGVALFRQLVRCEQARQQFYAEGRLPEFVAKPDALLELELRG